MYLKLLFLFSIILSPLVVSAKESKIVESQPQILFEHQNNSLRRSLK